MLLTYFLKDFEIFPVAPIITGITFVFTFHMRCIYYYYYCYYYYYWTVRLSRYRPRELRLPEFLDSRHMKGLRLST
jgi:hypothetical protein